MKLTLSTFALFLLITLLFSCDSNNEAEPATFSGVVLWNEVPAEGASIVLQNPLKQHTTNTDITGAFRFDAITPGEYTLTVKSGTERFMQLQKTVTISQASQQEQIRLPEGVQFVEVSDETSSSVRLKWNKSKIADFLEYKLYRHTTSGLDETTGTLVHVATAVSDTAFTDQGLNDKQTYYYRVFVRNSFGLYGGSNILEITTAAANYVVNGDFENALTSWELFTPDPCASLQTDATSPYGSTVLMTEINDISLVNISSEIFQTINHTKLTSGATYTLSFSARAESLTENSVLYVYLVTQGDMSRWASIKLDKNSATSWTEYSKDFIAPQTTTPYQLFIYAEPTIPWEGQLVRVWIDGIQLMRK